MTPFTPSLGERSSLRVGRGWAAVRQWLGHAAAAVGLAAAYLVAARLGLMMDAVAGFATLVWPATGIALAVLVRYGYRLWPGVFVGALVANVLTGAPLLVALGIGVGNTLEAVVGTYALRRVAGLRPALDRLRDVLALIGLAAGLSTTISATIGVLSLYLGGIVPLGQAGIAWRAWWLGDLIGGLVVAPVLLVWTTPPRMRLAPQQLLEAAALVVSVVALNLLIFGGSAASDTATLGQAYLVFPALIWAALRFGQHGAVSTTLLTSVIAVWGTASGHGPFARPVLHESLFALQTFMGVAAATFLVLGASIAERRRAEEKLRRAHETVTEANRAKSEFLAVMSHELRTPLNAISGYVDLMSMETQDTITETQRTYLSRIRSNQQHLLSMIEDVLSFAKVEAGRLALSMQTVNVCEMLGALESLVEPDLRRKELSFTRDSSDPSLAVRADPGRFRQILLNLLANAVKFTGPGGRLAVGAARERDRIRIWVSDTGIGIPLDQLELVFEPFFQVDRGRTRSYPGIGLGLAIARDFARAMGGELRLTSQPGEGTTASLELPSA
ncbi:MAG TPA: MASE1 domain-containing protein [Gemmatimonadaceae bacterium]|nr:MASE1 domain-containing protein [Gemmatimonadaceae bacterium]